jgi:voltage-gated potassium channel Kch/K+/H+ antiporter YhaU regulatory subunit KhtT
MWRQYLRYRFDGLLARGTWAVLLWLGIVTAIVVLIASLMLGRADVTLAGSEDDSWVEDFWQSMLRTIDSGTMASDTGWDQRAVALGVTVFGVLVLGTLIGVIASGVESRIDEMKRGRSAVVESDHLVVLGASSLLPVVVDQLLRANAGRRIAVVVMADRDPAELQDEVREIVESTRGNRLVFRYGDPTKVADLELLRLGACRSVIVLNGDGDTVGDARAVHTVLAVGDELGGFDRKPVIVVLDDARIGQALAATCGRLVNPFIVGQAVARNAAYALRQPGLGDVLTDVSDFNGSNLSLRDAAELVGLSFGEVLLRYENARPIGLVRGNGDVAVSPSLDTTFAAGDRLAVVSDVTEPLKLSRHTDAIDQSVPSSPTSLDDGAAVQHLLVIGWNGRGADLLQGWSMSTDPTSTVEIVFDTRVISADEVEVPELGIASVVLTPAAGGALADTVHATAHVTTIVLLSYGDRLPPGEADSRTLLDLIALTQDFVARDAEIPRVVAELLDLGNAPLAGARGAADVIVTPSMASRLVAQFADQPERRGVYFSLYAPGSASLRLVSCDRLGLSGTMTMRDVVRVTAPQGVVAIGWRHSGELVLNPHEDAAIQFADGDEIVLIG